MKFKNYLVAIIYVVIGIVLFGLSFAEVVDEFWSGMGSALFVIGAIRLVRSYRLEKNEKYREKIKIEESDERNHFIRNKTWAWTGYLFVLIAAVLCLVFRIIGQNLLSLAASGAVCLMLVLYWISYLVLKRKY